MLIKKKVTLVINTQKFITSTIKHLQIKNHNPTTQVLPIRPSIRKRYLYDRKQNITR